MFLDLVIILTVRNFSAHAYVISYGGWLPRGSLERVSPFQDSTLTECVLPLDAWNGLLERTNQRFEGIFKEIKKIINHVLNSVWWMDSSLSGIWSVKRSGELDCFYTLFKVDGRITSYA